MKAKDAKEAELIEKTKVSALWFEWSEDIDESKDRTRELEILNKLRPHRDLEELVIRVKNIGPEFCRDHGTSKCFESLEALTFLNMKKWEYWSPCEVVPNLHKLFLSQCPKLLGKLPNRLPLLKAVGIHDCEQLVVSVSSFPDQCKIEIEESNGLVCRSDIMFQSIKFKSIETISKLSRRIEGFDAEEWLSKLKTIEIYKYIGLESLPKALMDNSTCLSYIRIWICPSLTHLARGQLPPTLKGLSIVGCKNMRKLVEEAEKSCRSIPSLLEQLYIRDCPSLES